MPRALAVRGENDRPLASIGDEAVECGADIAIGEVERLLRVVALQEERAECRLAIARRPDLARAVERARLALDEQPGAELGIAAGLDRRVPAVALEIGRWMDVEDRRIAGPAAGHAVGEP